MLRRLPLILIVLAFLLSRSRADEPREAETVEIARLVSDLASDDFTTREQAVPRLIAIGRPALEAVGKAAFAEEPEARYRAVSVLVALAKSIDEPTAEAAAIILRKIAADGDGASGKEVQEALEPFARLDKMKALAESFGLAESADGKPGKRLPLSPRHVQRFVDHQRQVFDGTLWTYGGPGRPRAAIEVYPAGVPGQFAWYSAVASLTTEPLIAQNVDGVEGQNWTPGSWDQEFRVLSDTPPPLEGALERAGQFSQLARRFTAHQFWQPGETKYEMTVIADPVLRYSDEKAGIVDGGLFVVAHETNPEVILLIEVQQHSGGPQWMFAFAPLGSARMHVQLDEEEVWTCPTPNPVAGGGTQPYWAFPRRVEETK